MIANEPSNQQQLSLYDLNILKGLIGAKLAELNQTITLRQTHGFNAALPIILSSRGKVLMDKIRARLWFNSERAKRLLYTRT
jgi:CHASE3 domain sensor protein